MKFKIRHKQRGYFLAPLAAWAGTTAGATAIGAGAAVVGAGTAIYAATKGAPKIPGSPQPPTQDTAANAANQQADMMRKRRGVLANIAAGNATAPQVSAKTTLGS